MVTGQAQDYCYIAGIPLVVCHMYHSSPPRATILARFIDNGEGGREGGREGANAERCVYGTKNIETLALVMGYTSHALRPNVMYNI